MSREKRGKGTNYGFDAESFVALLKARLSEPSCGMEDLSVLDIARQLGSRLSTAQPLEIIAFIKVIDEGIDEVDEVRDENMVHVCTGLVVLRAVLEGRHTFLAAEDRRYP